MEEVEEVIVMPVHAELVKEIPDRYPLEEILLIRCDNNNVGFGMWSQSPCGIIELECWIENDWVDSFTFPGLDQFCRIPTKQLMETVKLAFIAIKPRLVAIFSSCLQFDLALLDIDLQEYYKSIEPQPLAELSLSLEFTGAGELAGNISMRINHNANGNLYFEIPDGTINFQEFITAVFREMMNKPRTQ